MTRAGRCEPAGGTRLGQRPRRQGIRKIPAVVLAGLAIALVSPCCAAAGTGGHLELSTPYSVSADLFGDHQLEAVVFTYTNFSGISPQMRAGCRSVAISNLKKGIPTIEVRSSAGLGIASMAICTQAGAWDFERGSGVYDVGDTVPHIIAFLGVGASYGADVRVWRWHGSRMEPLSLPPELSDSISPLYTTWTPPGGHALLALASSNKDDPRPPVLLAWNGSRYANVSAAHPVYYQTHFQVDIRELLQSRMPPDGWEHAADFHVHLLLLEGKPDQAVRLCQQILTALDDPRRTPPPTVPQGAAPGVASNIRKAFDQEIALTAKQVRQLLKESQEAEASR